MEEPAPANLQDKQRSPIVKIWLRFAYGILGAGTILLAIWAYLHRDDAYFINYCTSAIPVLLTIVIAFVPDLRKAHMGWRIAIVGVGLLWSLLLFRQIDIVAKQSTEDQKTLLTNAAKNANAYSDAKFKEVETHVLEVKDNLKTTEDRITTKLDQSTSTLSTGLKGVGKPEPPELAKLQFSLWKDAMRVGEWPLGAQTIQQEADGTVAVAFAVRNLSDSVQAGALEYWVTICDQCLFSGEPKGFDKPPGTAETMRHRLFGDLNPGVTATGNLIKIRFAEPLQAAVGNLPSISLQIELQAACKNCGKVAPTILSFNVTPAIKQP